MKIRETKIIVMAMLFILLIPLYPAVKGTIVYKTGERLDCTIDEYELGKYAVVVDENGVKRIISWDTISEIVLTKVEPEQPVKQEPAVPLQQTAAVQPVPTAVTPVPDAPDAGTASDGSMLDQFKKKPTEPEKKVNTKEEKFKQEIREENKYQQKPEVDYNKDSGKMGVSFYKTLESDATRRAWIEDGGLLKQSGFTANYTYASMDMDFGDGDTSFDMHGFGMSYSGTLKWVRPPSYAENRNIWSAFSLGATGSFSVNFGSFDMDLLSYPYWNGSQIVYIDGTMTTDMVSLNYEISGNIGYTFGLGRYFSSDTWRGMMLALYWKPNFVMNMNTYTTSSDIPGFISTSDTSDPETAFNLSGMQWTIDFGSFGALADKLAKEAHLSIGGFVIPETDTTPFMLSIGLGLVWY